MRSALRRELFVAVLIAAFALPALLAAQDHPTAEAGTQTPALSGVDAPVEVPPASALAMRYYRSGNWLWAFATVWGFAVPLAWVATGASARLRTLASRLGGGRWYPAAALYLAAFTLFGYLIDLPLDYYAGFARQHAYGLSNQTFGKWMGDGLKGLAIGLIVAVVFAWIPFWLLRKSPQRWWLWTTAISLPFVVFTVLVSPIWIDPLFNRFGPMQDKALEADILELAEHAGISGGRVFEVDKSVDTKAVNAYVTGIGNTQRIVLWDTILAKLERRQVLFVMAHEMGHYVLGHVWQMLLLIPLLILGGLWLIHRVSGAVLRRHGARFGFHELADVAAAPWLVLVLGFFLFLVSPLVLGFSRHLEHEADRFGLELTHDNRAAAEAFVRLQQENLGNPRPGAFYKFWRASHPPLGERIDFCNAYRPWETGGTLRYGDRFRATRTTP